MDITEYKQAEAARQESEQRFRDMLENVDLIAVMLDLDGRVTFCNDYLLNLTGRSRAGVLGQDWFEMFVPPESVIKVDFMGEVQQGIIPAHMENEILTTSGERRLISWNNIVLRDAEGRVIGTNSIGEDITARKRAEEALRESDKRFRALIENSADAITLLDAKGIAVYDSPASPGMLGYGLTDWIGKDVFALIHPDDLPEIQNLFENLTHTPDARVNCTFRVHHKSGSWMWIEMVATNLLDEPGVKAIVLNYHDITQRKQAEDALRESEERFRTWIENSTDLVTVIGLDGTIQYGSPSYEHLLGYKAEKLIGTNGFDLVHPDDRERVMEIFTQNIQKHGSAASAEFRFSHSDGSWRIFEGLGRAYLDEHGQMTGLINSRDITERKQAEKRMQRQLEHLAALSAIDRIVAAIVDLKLSLSEILAHVTVELEMDAAAVLLLNPHTQMLEYAAWRGFHTKAMRKAQVRLGEGHAGQVALERQLIQIPNLKDEPNTTLLTGEDFVCYFGVPLITKGQVKGVLEVFHRIPFDPDVEWYDFLHSLAGQTAIAIENATLFESLQRSNTELSVAYDATIEGWSHALDLRDKETEGHTQRVTEMTVELASTFGLSEAELVQVRWGSLLHDIGKMGVPDGILLKPGALTDEEWVKMKEHPRFAYELLSPIHFLRQALDIPYCHHEKWDGTGYPRGLQGEQIPLVARIFAVVDVWDALHSDRPYRAAWPEEKVREYIRALSGTHFDPQVVDVFMQVPNELVIDSSRR
jgi:PAS domain S-box-containing protein